MSLVLGLGTFTVVQAMALRDSAKIQRDIYAAIEGAARKPGDPKAVVLAPRFIAVYGSVPAMREIGSWVHDWRRPRLDLSDDVLFLRDIRGRDTMLRTQLPDRRFFRLQRDSLSPFLFLMPLAGGDAIPLTALRTNGP
jgi:hypothetical protein